MNELKGFEQHYINLRIFFDDVFTLGFDMVALSNSKRALAIWGAVALSGMVGADPGFTGGTKAVAERVAYNSGFRVSHKCPKVPQPKLEATVAELALRH